jgi:putative ABC transport system ATP-binding protein
MRRLAALTRVDKMYGAFKRTMYPEGEERMKGGLRRMLRVARPEAKLLVGAVVGLAITSASQLSLPKGFGFLVDAATGKDLGWTSTQIALGCLGVFAVGAVSAFAQTVFLKTAGERMMRRLRLQLFGSMLRQVGC